jgi:hypothetical protein
MLQIQEWERVLIAKPDSTFAERAPARNVIPYPERRDFEVYPGDAPDQADLVTASCAVEAAGRFLEAWRPALDDGESVEITVVDRRTSEATRLVIDIG